MGVLVLSASARSASAHAYLEAASPAAGAREPSAPAEVAIRFDERLDRQLSTTAIYDARSEKRITATVSIPQPHEMVLRPALALPRGSYRVEWHTVSTVDGHEVEGSFSFGVQAAAIGSADASTRSPLAGLGWLRVLIRAAMYAALFVFAGALMLRALLGARGRTLWILPSAVRAQLREQEAVAVERREHSVVTDAGMLAVALAAASAMIDTKLAAGNLSGASVHAFLLTNTSGLARVGLVTLLVLALSGATMAPRLAGIPVALALGALALSGHADSASPRVVAVTIDWVHLLAGAVWLGGIAMMALVWLPRLRPVERELRRAAMGELLPRFGRIAIPAFILVALTGLVNAYVQVRHPTLLWDSSYGRTLIVKSALVALIALLSYTHAFRLRPRLLASDPHSDAATERRHWRLIGSEPLLGLVLAVTVAVLVSFPTPAQIAAQRTVAAQPLVCNPCVLPLPAANQLSVATHVGSDIVAAWVARRSGRLEGQIRLLNISGQPVSTPFEIADPTAVSASCGLGCQTFTIRGARGALNITLNPDRRPQRASLPTRWRPGASAIALRILQRAQATMRRLRSVREIEQVSSVPGVYARSDYRLQSPDRLAYESYVVRPPAPAQLEDESVVIGATTWTRAPGARWQREQASGTLPFATEAWFTWSTFAQATRLIGIRVVHGRRLATIVLMDPGVPAWWTLTIDLARSHILNGALMTPGHFEYESFDHFNDVAPIHAPAGPRA